MPKFKVIVDWTMSRELEIEADSMEQVEEKAHQWNESYPSNPPGGEYALHSFQVHMETCETGGEILEGISVDEVVKMKEFVRAAQQNQQIGQTIVTEPNASSFYRWLEHECYGLIQDSIDKDDVKPIVVEMYGRRVEIDTHADNYEALCGFLKEVIEYEKEDERPLFI